METWYVEWKKNWRVQKGNYWKEKVDTVIQHWQTAKCVYNLFIDISEINAFLNTVKIYQKWKKYGNNFEKMENKKS